MCCRKSPPGLLEENQVYSNDTEDNYVLTERRETFLSARLRTVLEYICYATSFSNGRVNTQN